MNPRPVLLVLAMAAAAMYFVAGAGNGYAQSTEAFSISGRVVNGTAGADLPGELVVLMLVTGPGGTLQGTGQTAADREGRFILDDVQPVPGGRYTLSVDYGGVFYGTTLTTEGLAQDVTLTIYESSQDVGIVGVTRQVMVLASVDKRNRTARALEFVQVANTTDLTLMPDLSTPAQVSFLRFALPPGASDLTVQSGLSAGDIISIGSGFALTAPVPPGVHDVDFSYSFPYQGDGVSYRQSLPQGAGIFQALVPASFEDVALPGMMPLESINIEGTAYRTWEARDIPPGRGLELVITGLPEPGIWDRLGYSVVGGAFWQIAIPSAVAAALAALLVWGVTQRRQPLLNDGEAPEDPTGRAGLVRAVAVLDERFQQGAVPEAEYQAQRQDIVSRLLEETGASDGPVPPER